MMISHHLTKKKKNTMILGCRKIRRPLAAALFLSHGKGGGHSGPVPSRIYSCSRWGSMQNKNLLFEEVLQILVLQRAM